MKKYCILMTVIVLTLSLFTGCGCTSQKATEPLLPTRDTTPTVPATTAPTMPMTEPTMEITIPTETGAGETTDATGGMTDSTGPDSGNSTRSNRMR